MRRPPQENPAFRAKWRREIRPFIGMPLGRPAFAPLAGLAALWTISGCFNVNYANCRITCNSDKDCPGDLICVEGNLCAPRETKSCLAPKEDAGTGTDGGNDGADAMDGGSDGTDAMGGGDGGPPTVLCHNGNCLTLPEAVRANLVLLLWPSNLPAVGSTVSVWPDQSGQGNDAHALYPNHLPHVIANGVQLDSSQRGSGFVVGNSPSLDFASSDFAVIVVAGLSSGTARVSFFRKSDGARPSRQISIDWVLSASNAGQ